MVCLDQLPIECIDLIALHIARTGDAVALAHLSGTCRQLRETIIGAEHLWQCVFERQYDSSDRAWLLEDVGMAPLEWRMRVILMHLAGRKATRCLTRMETSRTNIASALASIVSLGPMALPTLRRALEHEPTTTRLTRRFFARRARARIWRRRIVGQWTRLLANPTSAPIEAASLIIDDFYFDVDRSSSTRAQLDAIADTIRPMLRDEPSFRGRLDRLLHELYRPGGTYHFSGDVQTYTSVENSLLCCVLERRLGIPISLGVLLSAVARRLNMTIDLVNFPSHIVLFTVDLDTNEMLVVDAFDAGKVYRPVEFAQAFAHRGANHSDRISDQLIRANPLTIWGRQLNNIVANFQSGELKVLELMSLIPPQEITLIAAWSQFVLLSNPEDSDIILERLRTLNNTGFAALQDIERRARLVVDAHNRDPVARSYSEAQSDFGLGEIVQTNDTVAVICSSPTGADSAANQDCYGIMTAFVKEPVTVLARLLRRITDVNELNTAGEGLLTNPLIGFYFDEFRPGFGFVPNQVIERAYGNRRPPSNST